MLVELIAIGGEILRGAIVNSNAAFISKTMQIHGWKISRHTVLPDDHAQLKAGLQEALQRSDIVITTGGLGPTCDDITRSVAAELFDSPFHYDEKIAADLKKRFSDKLISLEDQATVPSKAHILLNRVGTAPGFAFLRHQKCLIMLPGVPEEMKVMFTEQAIPYLAKHFSSHQVFHKILHLCLASESQVDLVLRKLIAKYPSVDFGIYPFWGFLSLSIASTNSSQLEKAEQELLAHYNDSIYSTDPEATIESTLHTLFVQKKKTLACAESCTGGMIAQRLTSIPGASDFFLGSFVTYSNALKRDILNVSENALNTRGAVSAEVVQEMLQGVFAKTTADYAIAVSGIAGPSGATPDKPVGTVWVGVGERGKTPEVTRWQLPGNRLTINIGATNRALAALWRLFVK